MLCYKDKTYCASDCIQRECDRYITAEIWEDTDRIGLPVDCADFSVDCEYYVEYN